MNPIPKSAGKSAPVHDSPSSTDESSSTANQKRRFPKKVIIPIFVIAGIFILTLSYFYIGKALINKMNSAYYNKACTEVTPNGKIVKAIYPAILMAPAKPALEKHEECLLFVNGVKGQEKSEWETAYTSYSSYLETYPNGIEKDNAYENAAQSLLSWSQELVNNKEYDLAYEKLSLMINNYENASVHSASKVKIPETLAAWAEALDKDQDYETAIEKMTLVLDEYGDSPVAKEAPERIAEYTLEWAKALNSQQDYVNLVKQLETLLEGYGDSTAATEARQMLPQAYLDLAIAQQNQGDYYNAEINYNKTIETDSNPQESESPASQAKAALAHFYFEWGNDAVKEKQYETALEQYIKALDYAPTEFKLTVINAQAACQIQWAVDLSGQESFNLAWSHLVEAEKLATDEDTKATLASERTQIVDAFSKSKGEDAQQFLKDATHSLCDKHEPMDIPILGILPEDKLISYLITSSPTDTMGISEDFLATTPGNMRYALCIDQKVEVVSTCPYYGFKNGKIVTRTVITQRILWGAELIDVVTGNTFLSKVFPGSDPPYCSQSETFAPGQDIKYYIGTAPTVDVINLWLLEVLK